MDKTQKGFLFAVITVPAVALVWSAINPKDYFTWFLEVLPVLIAFPILAGTYRQFTFTRLVYTLMAIHAVILIIGGHYTYAEMPLFNWLKDALDLSRNHYDRVGHFAQGFVPAIIAREILLRKSPLVRGKLLFLLVVSVCLAISASYEIFEWLVSISAGDKGTDFLGSQGDVWDTQWDMFMCLIGAIAAQLTLARLQDRQIEKKKVAETADGFGR